MPKYIFNMAWVRKFYQVGNCTQLSSPHRKKELGVGTVGPQKGEITSVALCPPSPLSPPQLETLYCYILADILTHNPLTTQDR